MFKNFKLKVRRLYWNLINKFNYYSPIYIMSLNFKKLWKEWKNVSDIFLKPSVEFDYVFNTHYYRSLYNNTPWKILYLCVFPLGWKTKYDDVAFEHNPGIILSLFFGLIELTWTLRAPGTDTLNEHIYWESILGYQYAYNKDLYKTYTNNTWKSFNRNGEHEIKYTLAPYLTEEGTKILEKSLKKRSQKVKL